MAERNVPDMKVHDVLIASEAMQELGMSAVRVVASVRLMAKGVLAQFHFIPKLRSCLPRAILYMLSGLKQQGRMARRIIRLENLDNYAYGLIR